MKKLTILTGLTLICIFLSGTNSWGYSYRCQIVQIIHHAHGAIVHVAPSAAETGFTEESKVFVTNDTESKSQWMFDMLLTAASGNLEVIISTIWPISWAPQRIVGITLIASNTDSDEERSESYYGPVFLETYSVNSSGSFYYVSDPQKLPEKAIAVRVPTYNASLTSLMTSAFMNGKPVLVAPSQRWWLGPNKLAWTIRAAKIVYAED
ncbi:MAG: hypothetical protein JRL30_03925 [Deltaproteobacteria bacterium]|nr:hypothetical protein [Deltaproteobacteria bacterium]